MLKILSSIDITSTPNGSLKISNNTQPNRTKTISIQLPLEETIAQTQHLMDNLPAVVTELFEDEKHTRSLSGESDIVARDSLNIAASTRLIQSEFDS
ncbi:hypothetical protein NPIL_329671 [Nephila pilipes]|uniref:Uncharacterized protein n=1 Tax=Nephila pilipes TaxID=299642 RepID=A0A8X6NYK3_NEPPI|nr:hypothetical protein NPIL_329671 [Nephila pilipes]